MLRETNLTDVNMLSHKSAGTQKHYRAFVSYQTLPSVVESNATSRFRRRGFNFLSQLSLNYQKVELVVFNFITHYFLQLMPR